MANRLPQVVLECLQNVALTNRFADDYVKHQGTDIYTKYLNQLTIANIVTKEESAMICEGLLNLFGTSCAEIIANAKKESEVQIHELSKANKQLSSQIDRLKKLLGQNNISFKRAGAGLVDFRTQA